MRTNKVEICGVNTSVLCTLSEEEKRQLLLQVAAGDKAAREKLILGNLRLVLSVIRRFQNKKESADDLFQVGCIGLMKAIDHFNVELGVRFSTYAVPMIIGEVRRFLRDNTAVRVSRGMRDLAYRALRAREESLAKEGRDLCCAELALRLGEPEREVAAALESIVEPMSLYDSVYSDEEDSVYIIDQLGDEGESDEIWVENIALADALKKLNDRERGIVAMRYYKGKTQMEIAEEIGISQAQVSRLEKGVIEKLRKYMS